MTNSEFKKVGRMLKELYKELEADAMEQDIDIFGEQFIMMRDHVRESLLRKMGFTLNEYREAKERVAPAKKNDVVSEIHEVREKVDDIKVPSTEDIEEIVEKKAKAPVVTNTTVNKIVKETTVEKPTIVKETNTIIEREEFDDKYLFAEIGYLNDRLDKLNIPEEFNTEEFRAEVRNMFGEMFEKNIDTLGMPDFRKLSMGLQAQIDENKEAIATIDPNEPEVWGDIGGTLSNQTDLQSALDSKEALGVAQSIMDTHEALADPHTQYVKVAGDTMTGGLGIGGAVGTELLGVTDGAVLFQGAVGATPTSGTGARMMWVPSKGAFRAGYANGTNWDDVNIGDNSACFGYNNTASGVQAFASGGANNATNSNAFAVGSTNNASASAGVAIGSGNTASNGAGNPAIGSGNTASGAFGAVAVGYNNTASNIVSVALGTGNTASGLLSVAIGGSSTAAGQSSIVIGAGNETTTAGTTALCLGFSNLASGANSIAIGAFIDNTAVKAMTFGAGVSIASRLVNNTTDLYIGQNSTVPTVVVTDAGGVGLVGNVGIGVLVPTDRLEVGGNIKILNGGEFRLNDTGDSHHVGFKAPALTATQIWTLPTADGSSNQVLTTNGSGVTSWATPTPDAYAHFQLSTTQNMGGANGTVHYVLWDGTEIHKDTGFTHSTATNPERVQVDADGRYEIKANVSVTQGGSARTTFMTGLRVNGTTANTLGRQRNYSRGSAYGDTSTGLNTEIDLTNGDYIEMSVTVDDSDGAYTSNAVAGECEFIIRKIA